MGVEKDPGEFWKQVNNMLSRSNKENENGRELRTEEEVARAFRGRLEKTFRISEEENEDFSPVTEEKVET